MKNLFVTICLIIALIPATQAQVITALPCDQLGMSINVGSDSTSISIYHSGQICTYPQAQNNFFWEFKDQQGAILNQYHIVDNAFANFSMNWLTNDTINVKVLFINDSAFLNTGNSINCLFEDQIHWKTNYYPNGTPYYRWEFIHNNTGTDLNNSNNLEDQYSVNKPQIFPNPVNDRLQISFKESQMGRISIVDPVGKVVQSIKFVGSNPTIDFSWSTPGIYTMYIETEFQSLLEKIIVE